MKYIRSRSLLIRSLKLLALFYFSQLCTGCSKLVSIQPPVSGITTSEVFSDSSDANSAILGIYAQLSATGTNISFGDGAITILTGLSSDELIPFYNTGDFYQFYSNTLTQQNSTVDGDLWQPGYQILYTINSCIQNIQASTGISPSTKTQLIGEAEFLRGLVNFYLVNLFENIPLITATDYKTNALIGQSSPTVVYKQIIADLYDAQAKLPDDYLLSSGQKVRANRSATTALLSKIYLYESMWDSAIYEATAVINSGNYNLVGLDTVFSANSQEAILQWNVNSSVFPYNLTPEGYTFVVGPSYNPNYFMSPLLLSAFENGDQRKVAWIDSTVYYANDSTYYFPYKYQQGIFGATPNQPAAQYYMVLRLGEQYLIRAEAEAHMQNLTGAATDLNLIRSRAALPDISAAISSSQVSLLAAIMHERQIELFSEWGNRWFDLRRTGQINTQMSTITPTKSNGSTWQAYQEYYPIPLSELILNPNLKENEGY
jgi:hypothetical protein